MRNFNKIGLRYCMRYLLILLVIFLSTVLFYLVAQKTIKGYIVRQIEEQVENGVSQLEEIFSQADLASHMVYSGNQIERLSYASDESTVVNVISLIDASDSLGEIRTLNDAFAFVLVLFKKNDYYITPVESGTDFSAYYYQMMQIRMNGKNINSSYFRTVLLGQTGIERHFYKLDSFTYNDTKEKTLTDSLLYVTSGSSNLYDSRHAFCFFISKEYLVNALLGEEFLENGFVEITEQNSRERLCLFGEENMGDAVWLESYMASINSTVRAGVSRLYINEQMRPVNRYLFIFMLITLLLAGSVIVFFGFSRYRGFMKVISLLPEETGGENELKGNAERILEHRVEALEIQRRSFRVEAETLRKQNKSIVLANLLLNGLHSAEEKKIYQAYLKQEPACFCVLLVRVLAERERFEEIISALLEKLLEEQVTVLWSVISGPLEEAFLVELSSDSEEEGERLKEIVSGMIREAEGPLGALHIGISGIGTELSKSNLCYEQARRIVRALENRPESVVQVYDRSLNEKDENPVNIEFLNQLYMMLISGQKEKLCGKLRELGNYYVKFPYFFEEHKEQIFYSLHNVFYMALLQLKLGEKGAELPVFREDASSAELLSGFSACSEWIAGQIALGKKSRNVSLKDRIEEYVEQHYRDPSLSACSVSQAVEISEKYLFQFWKEQTGEGFMLYVNRCRIEKAREYLDNSSLSNEKIAELVGFASVNTFYRNFSKYTGVTPKNYKDKISD